MLHKTKGIVFRSVRYGETSLIVTIFTELFGVQAFIVKGVRAPRKNAAMHAGYFEPGSLLDLVMYRNEIRNLQRIRECRRSAICEHLAADVKKHAVLIFTVELLHKCLKQPDSQPELFYFLEDLILALNGATPAITANMPAFVALQLPHFFGLRLEDSFSSTHCYLDIREGIFTNTVPPHPQWIGPPLTSHVADLLRAVRPADLEEIKINFTARRKILDACMLYYSLHMPDFKPLQSLPILQEVLG